MLQHVLQLRTMSLSQEGFGAVMCPTAPDPASLLEKAPTLSYIPQALSKKGVAAGSTKHLRLARS
jgi:hypothetical protein